MSVTTSKTRRRRTSDLPRAEGLPKAPTGIAGLDEITGGGLPAGRPTLVSGSAGAGKTMLAIEFLVHGALEYNEPGVFMMFEENAGELIANVHVRSLGFDLNQLVARKKLVLDHVQIERSEIQETGEYDLEGLFVRLGHAIDSIGAKRVVLDTVEALFAGLPNHAILRAELRRLFRWLKDRGLTAIITGERGETTLTRYGLEEYVADCVISLDHRVTAEVSTRRLRILKYRGSAHGTNEYPFLIGSQGFSVLPITALRLDHRAPVQRVPTGVARLDEMIGGRGYYRGSSILVSGTPGTGKSTIGASFVDAACRRGERALIFAYEESPAQIQRNMRSIGIDLAQWVRKGLLEIHSSRPTLQGLEQHLVSVHDTVTAFRPSVLFVDPISNLTLQHRGTDVKPTLMRLIDFMKTQQITAIFSSLTGGGSALDEESEVGVSSLMDTWLLLRNVESNGERNRLLFVLKSRGMQHSNQVREFTLGAQGVSLLDPYLGTDHVLTGSARLAQQENEKAAAQLQRQDHERQLRRLAAKQKLIASQMAALQAEAEAEAAEVKFALKHEQAQQAASIRATAAMSRLRSGPSRLEAPVPRKQ